MAKHLYAPAHTGQEYHNVIHQHVGHKLYADFMDGAGGHGWQHFTVEDEDCHSGQVRLNFDTSGLWVWFAVRELWAYGTPQCLTCEG